MKSLNRTRLLALVLLVAVLALGARYAWPHVQSLTSQADVITAQADDVAARAAAAEQVAAEQADYDRRTAAFTAAIPGQPALNEVIQNLQGICDRAGVEWISGVPQQATDAGTGMPGPMAWTVSMSVSSNASSLATFLDALREDPRLFVVDNVSLSSADGIEATASVVVRVFATGDGQ